MAYEFHYTPTGTGVISGKEVLEQTEDAINDLGNTAISGVQEALDKAEQALTNSENAVDDAQTALNTANNAEGVAIQAQNDVSNLSGTVTNIGNRVTTAEGNITNLQGRMTTAEGNITNLQGRMTTAEGNIGNLQTAVSTAQATANSAQQTATTARQQSYVFRYSSTALVASSTNSNALLDNTDNLKVGDKVIDSSGVLFSITAIDSVNSTFTVGSTLVDLALDANVVHTSGNESIGGTKTFSATPYIYNSDSTENSPNILFRNSKYAVGDTTDTGEQRIIYADKNGSWTGSISSSKNLAGTQYLTFTVYSTDNNNANISSTINYYLAKNGDRYFTPYEDNLISLGSTTRRWKSVCATNYYYGSNNVEFSTKFVTTDTNQTISGAKVWTGTNTFKQNITYERTNLYHQVANPCYILKDTELEKGSLATTHTSYPGLWHDKNGNVLGYVRFVEYSSGRQTAEFKVSNLIKNGALDPTGSEVNCAIDLELQPSGEKSLIPEQNNDINLGTSTNKWKSFNGLTPSSLGLPNVNINSFVDISGYFTNTGTGEFNTYPVTANGWIFLRLSTISSCQVSVLDGNSNLLYGTTSSGGIEQILVPVIAGTTFQTQWATASTVVINKAYFIPCQGNI